MSMLDDWPRIKAVLGEALAREGVDRAAYVADACGSDLVLRQHVDALLASDHASLSFLETPAAAQLELAPAAEDLTGRTVGTYRLIGRAGAGGMGEVYVAHDDKLDRRVAIKFIAEPHAQDADRLRRFRQEARAASSLNHPNILVVHDFGELAGRPFIVTEFVDGETLRDRLKGGPLQIAEAVNIAAQIAGALGAAHAQNLIHRDIKPENVMLRPDGYVKLLDFGLAKLARAEQPGAVVTFETQAGHAAGTPRYMSPEQVRGLDVDPSSDTWSLGALLYEMITRRPPFDGRTAADVHAAVLTSEPAPLGTAEGRPPQALVNVITRALRKNRTERYARGSDMAADLIAVQKQLEAADRSGRTPVRSGGHEVELPAAGERRRATVLVSIISEYASLVDRLAPDDMDRVVAQIRALAADVVQRHGGIVNQSIGEEIVSLFGVPLAHEDDDVAAVRAALELKTRVREIGSSLRVQSGLQAGSVVAQGVRDAARKYSVTGVPIETARRLAAVAEPDAVLISPELHRTIAGFVRTEARSAITVDARGKTTVPHAVIVETGADSRLAGAARLTPYTGRTSELAALQSELELACGGEGRLVIVLGEAGAGKSRLLHELRSHLTSSRIGVLHGRCRSHGGMASYLPFVQAVREVLDILEYEAAEPPVGELVERIHAIEPSLAPFVPLYLHLLSRDSEAFPLPRHLRGEHFSAAMHDALAALLTSYALRAPALLVLEDWHWSDEASREALRQLGAVVTSYPLLVVVTARPEPGMIEALPDAKTRINLAPLSPAASRAIIGAVLGTNDVSAELARRLYERTGGNPFFLEEMCHALGEAGLVAHRAGEVVVESAANLNLPDSIQGVIRSRIDRLNPDAREVLRIAAVIGREFTRTILADAMVDRDLTAALERLKTAGLVQQTRIVPDAMYRFKHALTQEVAYDSLLEHQRKALHLAVGRAIEQHHAAGPDAPLELLAYHFSRAEAWPDAIEYGERAAERAKALSEFADALALLERVHAWLLRLEPCDDVRHHIADVLLKQERACETLGLRSRQQQICTDLIALLAPHGASARLAEAYLRQGDVMTLLKRFDVADRALTTALRMSRERADAALERSALRSIGLLRWHEGRHAEALTITESALAMDRERGDDLAVGADLANLIAILRNIGQHERALACLEEALAMAAVADDTLKRLYIIHNIASVYRTLGDLPRALEYLQEANESARIHMLPIQRSFHLTAIAHIHLQQGQLGESLRFYQEAVQLSRRARHAEGLAHSLRPLGELLFTIGRDKEALACLQEAAQLFAQLEDRVSEAAMLRYVAVIRERSGHADAIAAWQRAREAERTVGHASGELDAVEGIARAMRRVDAAAAVASFTEAAELAARLGDQRRHAVLRNTLGILEWERGSYDEALRHYEAALALARQLGDRVHEGLTLNSIGVTLAKLHRYEEARTVLDEALVINRDNRQPLLEAHTLGALGDIAQALGRFEAALQAFEAALTIRRMLDDRPGEGWMLHRLAGIREQLGDAQEAARLADAAARIAVECGDAALSRACGITDGQSFPDRTA